jgi:benzil reductase ((S)-benzoin forming)
MKTVYITGVSRGLGYALALHYLSNGWKVVGLGRTHAIVHPYYTAIELNLLHRPLPKIAVDTDAEELVWINNAALVGPIGYLGSEAVDLNAINDALQVNLNSAIELSHQVITQIDNYRGQFTLCNISSGAGRNAYPCWAVYCASKAGLDMFSRVLDMEWKTVGKSNFRVFSVAPGIIDTRMQQQIRQTNPNDFPLLERFKNYHADGALDSPESVAEKLFRFIQRRDEFSEVTADLRLVGN